MNDIHVTHLQSVYNCDSKNLSKIVREYSQYTKLEEYFHQAIVERSLMTGYEDSYRYVDHYQILDFFRNPWDYRDCRFLPDIQNYFLQEWYYPNIPNIPNNTGLPRLTDLFAETIKKASYEEMLASFDTETEDPEVYNLFRHLLWLSLDYTSEYERVLSTYTKLTYEETETLFETLEDYRCWRW